MVELLEGFPVFANIDEEAAGIVDRERRD